MTRPFVLGPEVGDLPVEPLPVEPHRTGSVPAPYRFYSIAEMGLMDRLPEPPIAITRYSREGVKVHVIRLEQTLRR